MNVWIQPAAWLQQAVAVGSDLAAADSAAAGAAVALGNITLGSRGYRAAGLGTQIAAAAAAGERAVAGT